MSGKFELNRGRLLRPAGASPRVCGFMSMPAARKVLLIGWDAADWKVINPLLDQGLMPTLDDFINHGVMGNIATLRPILSPMLWNSIGTGMRPDKHGIHGFMEPDPQNGGVR